MSRSIGAAGKRLPTSPPPPPSCPPCVLRARSGSPQHAEQPARAEARYGRARNQNGRDVHTSHDPPRQGEQMEDDSLLVSLLCFFAKWCQLLLELMSYRSLPLALPLSLSPYLSLYTSLYISPSSRFVTICYPHYTLWPLFIL